MERPPLCNEGDSHWQFLQPKELKFSATSKPPSHGSRPPLAGTTTTNGDLRKMPPGNRRLKAIPVLSTAVSRPPPNRRLEETHDGGYTRKSNTRENVGLSRTVHTSSSSFGADQRSKTFVVEGNSVLNTENNHAFQVLDHLGNCVAVERRLREELERVRKQKLDAFREVVRLYLRFIRDQRLSAGQQHADGIQLARCSVITNTLATTIQSYMRRRYSMQLSTLLRQIQGKEGSTRCSTANRAMNLPSCNALDEDTRSVEDVLDTKEINELKQLYFDYFDCETVSVGSEGEDCLGALEQARRSLCSRENEVSSSNFSTFASTTM